MLDSTQKSYYSVDSSQELASASYFRNWHNQSLVVTLLAGARSAPQLFVIQENERSNGVGKRKEIVEWERSGKVEKDGEENLIRHRN